MLQLSIVNFKKDMYIFVEGKRDEGRFFIIREGHVKITKQSDLIKKDSDLVLGPGDFVGIVAALAQRSQIESARALSDVTLLAVNYSQFEELIQTNTPVAMKIIQQFSRRIRYLNDALTGINPNTAADTNAETLFKTGEYYLNSKMKSAAYYVFNRYIECYPDGEFARQAETSVKSLEEYGGQTFKTGNDAFLCTYGKDKIIFADGEFGNSLYIIQEGTVKITKILEGNEIILAILRQGDIFGEMALLENKPRSASAMAQEDKTILMEVSKRNFELMSRTHPAMIQKLTRLLSERIWFSYKQLINASLKDPMARIYNYLSIILEKNKVPRTIKTYIFDFGQDELMKMAAVPAERRTVLTGQLFKDGVIQINGGKLFTKDVDGIFKLSDYYQKMCNRDAALRR
ncbi:MAG: Crp/Fnr family transcriptional regulator [Spirochaetaceae bacterium]|jgi:CRP-like cAMP-binding protein|nr:Crp/Fnr family transcriptional regulator [Spirochaetaceae bacterium]